MEEASTLPMLSSNPLRSELEFLERGRNDGGRAGGTNFTSRRLDGGERGGWELVGPQVWSWGVKLPRTTRAERVPAVS